MNGELIILRGFWMRYNATSSEEYRNCNTSSISRLPRANCKIQSILEPVR
jgi:hypothetical protein